MVLKLYFDLLSEPSRAVLIFLENCKIPYEKCPVELICGEHLTDEYKTKVSRFQKVPVIKHEDFKLTESIAIVRYLSREFNIDNHWYPRDSKIQSKVDEYLEWHHINLRDPCISYFLMMLRSENFPKIEEQMIKAVDNFERVWLTENQYIAGNQISVADIFASCELEQSRLFGHNFTDGRLFLSRWWTRVRSTPHYEEIHAMLNKAVVEMSKQ